MYFNGIIPVFGVYFDGIIPQTLAFLANNQYICIEFQKP